MYSFADCRKLSELHKVQDQSCEIERYYVDRQRLWSLITYVCRSLNLCSYHNLRANSASGLAWLSRVPFWV